LTHEKGIQLDDNVLRLFPTHAEHDPSDIHAARELAEDIEHLPLGILYHNPDVPRYDLISQVGMDTERGTGPLRHLTRSQHELRSGKQAR
jgi:2-oxoglutarate ferredoxin oxidoreductase subunit beta